MEQSELPHFHFNEALLKPFENLLSMESCDIDVQDQIVACLYEIVEAHRTEIRSGWRPLFGTLRNARNRPLHISNVTDIFRVFLDSDNTLVFANAGLDCILCLLSYLEITGNGGSGSSINGMDDDNNTRPTEFLHETLKFLERCASILAFMYNMPKCPNLHSTYKIKGISYTHIIDANIPNSMENFTYFGNEHLQNNNEQHMISYRSLHIDKDKITKLDELDKPSGVLKVWFLLLDGLTNSLIVCPNSYQSPILQCIFKLFRSLINSPGIDFGFYCINHLLIPMIQDWLRYVNKTQKNWYLIEKNFKHCCGMTTDLVVEFIEKSQKENNKDKDKRSENNESVKHKFTSISRPIDNLKYNQVKLKMKNRNKIELSSSSSSGDDNNSSSQQDTPTKIPQSATLALKQLLLVLIECTAQSQESVARVGVSCLKHIILSTGYIFNDEQWMVACSAIHRACTVTIAPLRQLAFAFNEKSNSFYGDCATVKVTARRDSTIEELNRVHSLAQQVFLMDNQRDTNNKLGHVVEPKVPFDDRSYSFLLYPMSNGYGSHNIDNFVIRVPYRNLIVGLLANQMLLQLVANLLLGRLKSIPTSVHSCIFDSFATSTSKLEFDYGFRPKEILLRCIRQYNISSMEFDARPGLKFLIQKVSNIDYAANLYKQMNSSWMIYFLALVDSYLNDINRLNLSIEDVKFIIESYTKVNQVSLKKKDNFVRYLFYLQDSLNMVCELYLNNSNIHGVDAGCLNTQNDMTINEHRDYFIDKEEDNSNKSERSNNGNGENTEEFDENKVNKFDQENKPESTEKTLQSEENVSMSHIVSQELQSPRMNPFNTNRMQKTDSIDSQTVSPEIEQQRATSILKDSNYKKAALTQLVVASMELLRSLPEDSASMLKLLLTPTIREAFRLIQLQGNELKVNQF